MRGQVQDSGVRFSVEGCVQTRARTLNPRLESNKEEEKGLRFGVSGLDIKD